MDWREVTGLLRIPGQEIHIHSSGAASRGVVCEKCHQKYFYALRCDAVVSERSVLFLENKSAEERATQAADEQLAAALRDQILPVPCPRCGWYQADMVAICREQYGIWMIAAAIVSFIGICVSFVATMTMFLGTGLQQHSDTLRIVWSTFLVFFIVLTASLFWLQKFWSARYDPNEKDPAERIRIGQSKAFLAEDDGEVRVRDKQLELQSKLEREAASSARFDAMFYNGMKILVPLGISIFCFASVYSSWDELQLGAATNEWPRMTVTIEATGIDKRQKEGGKFESYFVPTVHYSYEVEGEKYHGTQIQIPEPQYKKRQEAEELVDYLNRQGKMQGRYNPVDPKQSVIMAGLPEAFLSKIGNLLIIGAIGMIASIVLAIIYRKTFFRSK